MPKVSSRLSPQDKVLDEINQKSLLYAKKATLLSEMLEQSEKFLSEMPGKISVRTDVDYPRSELGFEKSGGNWRLLLYEFEGGETKTIAVTQGTIVQKAEAAQLLPELYELLVFKLTEGQEAVELGLQALSSLPFLDFSSHKDLLPKPIKKEDDNAIPF